MRGAVRAVRALCVLLTLLHAQPFSLQIAAEQRLSLLWDCAAVTASPVIKTTRIASIPMVYTRNSAASVLGGMLTRKPTRVTATLNWALHQRLQERADREGRSLSNLIGHLLEISPTE